MIKFFSNLKRSKDSFSKYETSSKYEKRALRMGSVHRSLKINSKVISNNQANFFFIPGVEAFSIPPEIGPYTSTLTQIANDLHISEKLNGINLNELMLHELGPFVNQIKIPSYGQAWDYFWKIYDPNNIPAPKNSPLAYAIREATYLFNSNSCARLVTMSQPQMLNKNPFVGLIESGETKYLFLTQPNLNASQLVNRCYLVTGSDFLFVNTLLTAADNGAFLVGPAIEGLNAYQKLEIIRSANQTNQSISTESTIINITTNNNTNMTNMSKPLIVQAFDGISQIGLCLCQNFLSRAKNFTAIFDLTNPNKNLDGTPRLSFQQFMYLNSASIPIGNICGTIKLDSSLQIPNCNENSNFIGPSLNESIQCYTTVSPGVNSSAQFLELECIAYGRNYSLPQVSFAMNCVDMFTPNYSIGVGPALGVGGNYSSTLMMPHTISASPPVTMICP